MKFSAKSLKTLEVNQSKIAACWEYLRAFQKIEGVDVFLLHPLGSLEELKQVYLEYLWLLERLEHPKDLAYFKDYFIPINGYLEGFFDISGQEYRFFEAQYFSVKQGMTDWTTLNLVDDIKEWEQVLADEFNFSKHYSTKRNRDIIGEFDVKGLRLLADLKQNKRSQSITGSINTIDSDSLLYKNREVALKETEDALAIYPVTGLAPIFLPEVNHKVRLRKFWCWNFAHFYTKLKGRSICKRVKSINQLFYAVFYLGSHSEKSYQGHWESEEYGKVRLFYQDKVMIFGDLNSKTRAKIKENIEQLLQSDVGEIES